MIASLAPDLLMNALFVKLVAVAALTADNCGDQKGGICRARYLGAIQIPPSNGKSLPGEIWALGEISRFREESEISPCNYRLLRSSCQLAYAHF